MLTVIWQEYYEIVKTQLMSEKGNINFLTADGNQEHKKKYLFHWYSQYFLQRIWFKLN